MLSFCNVAQHITARIYVIEVDPSSFTLKPMDKNCGEINQLSDTVFKIIEYKQVEGNTDTIITFIKSIFTSQQNFENEKLYFYFDNAKARYFQFENRRMSQEFYLSVEDTKDKKAIVRLNGNSKNWLIGNSVLAGFQLFQAFISNW